MTYNIREIWDKFVNDNISRKDIEFRKSSASKKAHPYIETTSFPSLPTQMMSKMDVYGAWLNQRNMKIAKEIVNKNTDLTLLDLANQMLYLLSIEEINYPYIWWVYQGSHRRRVIYQDSRNQSFVKLGKKWQRAYSIRSLGTLVGAQGAIDYEDVPVNSYFVLMENETAARRYF